MSKEHDTNRASLNEKLDESNRSSDIEFLQQRKESAVAKTKSQLMKSKASKFLIQGDHQRCANFRESRYKCLSPCCLRVFRAMLFLPMLGMLIWTMTYKPKDVAYFESYWTFLFTVVSLFTSMMAHYSRWWHSIAVYTSEIAMCFNICVVPVFWGARLPGFISDWKKNEYDTKEAQWVLFQLCFVHSTPFITSVIELSITKMCFLKKDSKWVFLVAILYIPVNYWGGLDNGQAMYDWPILNWSTWYVTLGAFVFQAFVMFFFNYSIALCTQKKMGFVENLKQEVKRVQEESQKSEEFQGNNYLSTPGNAPLVQTDQQVNSMV